MQKWQYRVGSYVKSQQFCDISVSIIYSWRYKQHTTFSLIPQALGSISTTYKFNHLSKRKRFPLFLLYHCFSFLELIISFYYIDTSVLLENIPLVKFIKTTSGTSCLFSIISHVSLSMTLFRYIISLSWQKQYFTHSLRSFVKYCFATRK